MILKFHSASRISVKGISAAQGQPLLDIAINDLSGKDQSILVTCSLMYTSGNLRFFVANEGRAPEFKYSNAIRAIRGYRAWMEGKTLFKVPTIIVKLDGEGIGQLAITVEHNEA